MKDAASVKNLASFLGQYRGTHLLVVVSAMSKTTNRLEQLATVWHRGDGEAVEEQLAAIKRFHFGILEELLPGDRFAFNELSDLFNSLWSTLIEPAPKSYDRAYEMVVPYGELLSTVLIWHYLKHTGLDLDWLDARKLIITDETWREGRINWERTTANLKKCLKNRQESGATMGITQGFIASTGNGDMITLGREGSDFTAAVIAYALDAEEVVIWKDVPGLMNADPAIFHDAVMLPELSFHEAIELAYYGAKVIHPKTIKPLQNKNIPLKVKSFLNPDQPGSLIHSLEKYDQQIPSYIIKKNQTLISFSPKDFSFIAERNISDIFSCLSSLNIRANLMQNSAISFSVCIDDQEDRSHQLISMLNEQFAIRYNRHLTLITIRHFTEEMIDGLIANAKVILEQRSRNTVQLVVSEG